MSEILPRALLPQEGNSALCLKASGSNSFAGFKRAIKAADLWAPREQLTPGRTRFHWALCGQSPHEELIPSRTIGTGRPGTSTSVRIADDPTGPAGDATSAHSAFPSGVFGAETGEHPRSRRLLVGAPLTVLNSKPP